MKRLLILALACASIGTVGLTSETQASNTSPAKATVATSSSAQWQRDRYRRSYARRRTVRRVVRHGRRLYRETLVVWYSPNGRVVDTRVISRVRIS